MRAEIIARNGKEITVRLFDELTDEEAKRYEIGGRLFAYVELFDENSITNAQRNHIYALLGDIQAKEGSTVEAWEDYMKVNFMHMEVMQELPSFAANNMTKEMASKFIEFLVIFCIRMDIPFRKEQIYLPKDSSKYIFWATMTRHCVVCGKPHADIHHATNLVGMGNDRRKHDHWNSSYFALCRRHHNEVHNTGLTKFNEKYLLKPVKLNKRQLKEIGVM